MCHYVQKTEDLPTPSKSLKELEKENKLRFMGETNVISEELASK